MGFDFLGKKVFDFSQPFGAFELWCVIAFVVGISFIIFLILAKKAQKYQDALKNQ